MAASPPATHFTVASLVAPIAIDEFLRTYLGSRFLHQRGTKERFASLLPWEALSALIRDQRWVAPRMRVTKSDKLIPETAYTRTSRTLRGAYRQLDIEKLSRALREGATLVIDAIDQAHAPVREIKQAFERALGAFAWVNTYASWGTTSGVAPHWDDHDAFILQITGRKRWRIATPTRPWPIPEDLDGVYEPPQIFDADLTLEAGDLLYLPRGFWHEVTPLGEPSLHLTAGLLRPTNADFLSWVFEQAKFEDLFRRELPRDLLHGPDAGGEARGDAGTLTAQHLEALRGALDRWLSPAGLRDFVRTQDESFALDPRPTLRAIGQPASEDWDGRAEAILLGTRAQVEERSDDVVLRIAGKEWIAPPGALSTLKRLAAGERVAVGTLRSDLSPSLTSTLVASGLVAIL